MTIKCSFCYFFFALSFLFCQQTKKMYSNFSFRYLVNYYNLRKTAVPFWKRSVQTIVRNCTRDVLWVAMRIVSKEFLLRGTCEGTPWIHWYRCWRSSHSLPACRPLWAEPPSSSPQHWSRTLSLPLCHPFLREAQQTANKEKKNIQRT